jgi:hypothetical protein
MYPQIFWRPRARSRQDGSSGMKASGRPPQGALRFATFSEFYPYYLQQHENRTARRLHVLGTALAIVLTICAGLTGRWLLLPAALVAGYAFAWIGHFFFEHNSPATFRHPLYSLRGDFKLLREVLSGRLRW